MLKINMLGYKIVGLELLNQIQEAGPVQLRSFYDFDVKFNKEGGMSFATLKETIEMIDHPEMLHIDLMLEGMFEIEGVKSLEDRKEVHLKCHDELFPYAKQIVSHLCVDTGLPGLSIPKNYMELDKIHFKKEPKKGKIIELK